MYFVNRWFSWQYYTGYCYGAVSYKASHATATTLWSAALPTWVPIIPNSSTRVLCSGCSRDT
jgi:hypothetical protein